MVRHFLLLFPSWLKTNIRGKKSLVGLIQKMICRLVRIHSLSFFIAKHQLSPAVREQQVASSQIIREGCQTPGPSLSCGVVGCIVPLFQCVYTLLVILSVFIARPRFLWAATRMSAIFFPLSHGLGPWTGVWCRRAIVEKKTSTRPFYRLPSCWHNSTVCCFFSAVEHQGG